MISQAHNPDVSKRTLQQLLAAASVRVVGQPGWPSVPVEALTADSRSVRAGSCFFAIRGTSVDGCAYIAAAVRSGAIAVVVDRDVDIPDGVSCVRVDDVRVAYARCAAAWYDLMDQKARGLSLVGITGTNGKTTVSWMLRSILAEAGKPTALIGTVEYDLLSERVVAALTTPDSLDLCRHLDTARRANASFAVLEVSSHALDQRRCDGLPLAAAVFTNLSGDHLDYHGTDQRYAEAKRGIFDLLSPDGVAVINRDDPVGASFAKTLAGRVVTFGTKDADVCATVGLMDVSGTHMALYGREFVVDVQLPQIGRHNVENALAAAATAEALGIGRDAIQRGLERLTRIPGRLERVEQPGWPFAVFVDYAHTDAALLNVLQTLRPLTRGKLICVFGCGGDRDRHKRPRMAIATETFADVAIVTSDNPRTESPQAIIDEILPGFGALPKCDVVVQADRGAAIEGAIDRAKAGDTVLIAGKGHEDYQLVGDAVLSFDDVKVARSCMTSAREGAA